MATNLALDDRLIVQVQKTGAFKTKKEAVTAALKEFLAHRRRQAIIGDFGTVDLDPDYEYKKARKR